MLPIPEIDIYAFYTYPASTASRTHAPLTIGAESLGYDANGNMTGDGSRVLVWDAGNRLKTVTLSGTTVTYAYGTDGARSQKTAGTATTLYPYICLGGDHRRRHAGLRPLSASRHQGHRQRDKREHPGEVIHIDIKKLGRFDRVGQCITGDPQQGKSRGAGCYDLLRESKYKLDP